MSDSREIHRGRAPLTGAAGRVADRVSASSIERFLAPSRPPHSAGRIALVSPPRDLGVRSGDLTQVSPAAEVISIRPPTQRIAVVALGEAHFESTVALSVAVVRRLATATGAAGGIVTVDGARVSLAKPRRRRAVELRGFASIGRIGPVALIDASDAEPATIATAGVLPIACVITAADGGLAGSLARLCPSSLLLVADDSISDDYAALLAGDLARAGCRVAPRVLRYGSAGEGVAIAADSSAAMRLKLGFAPGRRCADNAEAVIAALEAA